MKTSYKVRWKTGLSNPKFSTVKLLISKKNNPDRQKVVSANSKFITIDHGQASINLREIKKGKWVIVGSVDIPIPDNAPKITTSTGPKRIIKKVF